MSKQVTDSRQIEHRTTLPRISSQQYPTLKQSLPQIDKEITPLFELRQSSTPNLTLNIGAGSLQNSDTLLTRAFSPIKKKYFSFTSGTIVFPASSGGTITVTPGTNNILTLTNGNFIACLVQIDYLGNLSVVLGTEAASSILAQNSANFPKHKSGLLPIGFVVLENNAGAIQNIINTNIVQFSAGGGGGSGSDLDGEMTLANNQVAPANVTDFLVDPVDGETAKVDYSIVRKSTLVYAPAFFNAAVPGVTGNVVLAADNTGTIGNSIVLTGYNKTFNINGVDSSKFGNTVNAIYEQTDKKVVVGGSFVNYAGTSGRNRLLRLNSDGTLDTTFCTNAVDGSKFNNTILAISVQTDNKILVGGAFINYAGTSGRSSLIRLNSDGTLDTAFCTNAVDSTKFNNTVFAIDIQTDGKILVGGHFTTYAGTSGRDSLIRLNSDGTLDTTFCTNAVDGSKFGNIVYAIDVQTDNKILVGGAFTNYAGTSGRDYLIRLNSDGTLDTTFCTNAVDGSKFGSAITSIAKQTDGKILVGGYFINYAGTSGRSYLIRLNSDGTLDTTFCTNAVDGSKFSSTITSIAKQIDGKVLVGGIFTNYAGTSGRSYLIRLNSDGTLDTTFCTNAVDSNKFSSLIHVIYVKTNTDIFVGGLFTNYAGTSGRNYLISIVNDGTLGSILSLNTLVSNWNAANPSNTVTLTSLNGTDSPSDGEIMQLSGGTDALATYLKENGAFYIQYDDNTTDWRITGENFAGDNAGIIFSILSNQMQYTSTNIPGVISKSTLKYIIKYL